MRTAAKILNIVSLICYALMALMLLWVGFLGGTVLSEGTGDYSYLLTATALLFEFLFISASVFVAAVSIKKVSSEETKRKDFILWGVLNIFLVSPVSGVLTLLCMNDAKE